eukprot:5998326-Pyramimonas_sp.AAC.1
MRARCRAGNATPTRPRATHRSARRKPPRIRSLFAVRPRRKLQPSRGDLGCQSGAAHASKEPGDAALAAKDSQLLPQLRERE